MARVLRLLSLLVSFVALQLTLASGGPGCPMPTSAPTSSMAGTDMAGTDMAGTDMAGMDMAGMGAAPDAAPCDDSTAPVTCPTMAPCVFAALPPLTQVAADPAVPPRTRPAALRVLMPPSVSAAPELPPPRA